MEVAEQGPAQVAVAESAVARVVVVESQCLMRQALRRLLEGAGFAVVGEHADPSAFVARAPEEAPTVVVLGLRPRDRAIGPIADGPALVGMLRQRCPGVQLLVFSGSVEPEVVERCYALGAAGFLDKDTAHEEAVVEAVRAVAQGERIFPLHLMTSPFSAPAQRPEESPVLQAVSLREREVLTYVAAGADNLKIASLLEISERTVKAHVSSLYRKIGSENRTQLALAALQLGVRPSPRV